MCWADKIALSAFAIAALVLLAVGVVGHSSPAPAYADVTMARWLGVYLEILWLVSWKWLLPAWLVLRALDFIFRRRARGGRSSVWRR